MRNLLTQCPTLKNMLERGFVETPKGKRLAVDSYIPITFADALYETVLRTRPILVIEIGMAFGVSSLAILTALRDIGQNGKLISIDPWELSGSWEGGGVAAVAQAGLSESHTLIEDYDYKVLPQLLASDSKPEFAYIDGWHTFDHVLLDWWYLDKMLPVGGIVGFNDCGWPAVDKAIRFVLTHRKYKEMNVGLTVEFEKSGLKQEFLHRFLLGNERKWKRQVQDRYFEKIDNWEPKWDFFVPF